MKFNRFIPDPSHRNTIVLIIHLIVTLLLFTLLQVYLVTQIQDYKLVHPLSIIGFVIFIWIFVSYRFVSNTLFSPYALFLMAAVMFNCGLIILEALHLNESTFLDNLFTSRIKVATMFITIFGLCVLHLGALIVQFFIGQRKFLFISKKDTVLNLNVISFVGWFFFFISFYPRLSLLYSQIKLVLSSGYFIALYQQGFEVGITNNLGVGIGDLFIPSLLLILAGSRNRKFDITITALLIIVITIATFFLGKRSDALLPLIAYMWLFHKCIRPIPMSVLTLGGSAVLFIIMPVIAATRNIRGDDRSFQVLKDSFLSIDNPVVSVIKEMGSSVMTTAYTMQIVPQDESFSYGKGFYYAIRFVTPNSIWNHQPLFDTASSWLISNVNQETANAGGGIGFSFIAESYLNFGWFGILYLFFLGIFFNRVALWAEASKSNARLALVACSLNFVLFYARGELIQMTRSIVWYAIVPYIIIQVITVILSKKKANVF